MSSKKHSVELAKLARTYHVSGSVTDSAIFDFLSALDCPYSLQVWLLYSNKEFTQLVNLDIDPHHYNDAESFRDAYAAYSLLSKSDFFKLDISKKDAAFTKFFKYEEQCGRTNNRFRNLVFDPKYHGSNVWLLNATIRKIASILGDYSPEEIVDNADWGPGVTTLLKGEHVSAINKFHSENGITRDLYSLVSPWFSTAYPLWSKHLSARFGDEMFNFQVGNGIVTVPKNSKTDRVIAVEPGINLWFQKGIGRMISRRLRRWGIDLTDQVRNQQLSREASTNTCMASLATVDFSSASDSIAKELVRELLPPDWFQLLNACRSPLGLHNKTPIRWQKFSSMGNGYTFELESLIFFAAALAVCDYSGVSPEKVSVFGDDVIIPVACYDLFASFSEFLGFTVNKDKSFSSSYFRESCGAHWYNGVDCKPIFLKERLSNVQSIYKLANSVRAIAHRRRSGNGCDRKFRGTWYHLLQRVPRPLRLWTSLGYGDGGFICNFDEASPSLARDGIEGYYTSVLMETAIKQSFDDEGLLLARIRQVAGLKSVYTLTKRPDELHLGDSWSSFELFQVLRGRRLHLVFPSLTDEAYGNLYALRGRTRAKLGRMLIPQWYNLGPWV